MSVARKNRFAKAARESSGEELLKLYSEYLTIKAGGKLSMANALTSGHLRTQTLAEDLFTAVESELKLRLSTLEALQKKAKNAAK